MLVVDASCVTLACVLPTGLAALPKQTLAAPALLWSEVSSALHEARWRRELSAEAARAALQRLLDSSIQRHQGAELADQAWRIADRLGMAKTYDAEYVALARLLGCPLLTADARLRRQASRLATIVGPTEL